MSRGMRHIGNLVGMHDAESGDDTVKVFVHDAYGVTTITVQDVYDAGTEYEHTQSHSIGVERVLLPALIALLQQIKTGGAL